MSLTSPCFLGTLLSLPKHPVRDLKMLWRAIEPVHPTLRMKSQAAKNKWVDAVVMALNTPGLVLSLPRAPMHQSYIPVRPCAVFGPMSLPPPPRDFIPIMLPEPAGECPFERSLQCMFGDPDMLAAATPPPILPGIATSISISSSVSSSAVTQKRKRDESLVIKMEPGCLSSSLGAANNNNDPDDDAAPLTLQESAMLYQLRQMGFSDEQEMLAGIRHVTSHDLNKRVDDAMMWIVQQREEAEEAKKMDAVRARSEQLRQEQSDLKRRYKKERMDAATMHEWKTEREFFQGSVVLQLLANGVLETVRTNGHKQVLEEFLELEKNARKWFGPRVPFCFFVRLAKHWSEPMPTTDLVNAITSATMVVQKALFSLSEQQGGVPKIFLLATKEFEEQGLPTGPEGTNDDDEVTVIEELLESEFSLPNETDMIHDVIEIDL